MYLWAKDVNFTQTKAMMTGMLSQDSTFVDWRNYIRKVCVRALNEAQPMAGPGHIVQVDKNLMRGHQKN